MYARAAYLFPDVVFIAALLFPRLDPFKLPGLFYVVVFTVFALPNTTNTRTYVSQRVYALHDTRMDAHAHAHAHAHALAVDQHASWQHVAARERRCACMQRDLHATR